jgi:hypothetical protein
LVHDEEYKVATDALDPYTEPRPHAGVLRTLMTLKLIPRNMASRTRAVSKSATVLRNARPLSSRRTALLQRRSAALRQRQMSIARSPRCSGSPAPDNRRRSSHRLEVLRSAWHDTADCERCGTSTDHSIVWKRPVAKDRSGVVTRRWPTVPAAKGSGGQEQSFECAARLSKSSRSSPEVS